MTPRVAESAARGRFSLSDLNIIWSKIVHRKNNETGDVATIVTGFKLLLDSAMAKKDVEQEPKVMTSTQVKRKKDEERADEPELQCETNNRSFTNKLREGIQKIAEENSDYNEENGLHTVGYYAKI